MTSQDEADKITQIVFNHFQKHLPKRGKPSEKEWTTLAAIVQCETDAVSSAPSYKVVSLGTGTKCLGQNELSPLGDLVSDCHAEALARRGFLLYLYTQIDSALLCDINSIFEIKQINNSDVSSAESCDIKFEKQFILLPNVTFHLFVSHLPCGDAAIIEDSESKNLKLEGDKETTEDRDEPPDCKKMKVEGHQKHRTGAKLEAGPLVYEDVQLTGKCRVKPGKGDPTLCMSCSDKLAKWQLLGLQGSLLGNLIPHPIRLSSIIIGNSVPFSQHSINRAIFTRFESQFKSNGLFIKDEYKAPHVFQASVNVLDVSNDKNVDSSKNPSPGSIVWHFDPFKSPVDTCQVIVNGRKQGATKKNFGKPSAMVDICRKRIFSKFGSLVDNCRMTGMSLKKIKYAEAKGLNVKYKAFWSELKARVFKGWTTKQNNMMEFYID